MTKQSNRRKPLHIALLTVVALAVLTAGVAGLATAETDSDRTIENETLAPGASTNVDVTIADANATKVAAFENASHSLRVTDLDESQANLTGVSDDERTLFFAYDEEEWSSPQTFNYELTLSEDAEAGDLVGVTGDASGTETNTTTGDNVMVVGDQAVDSTTVDIDLDMTPNNDTEMAATVLIETPAGENISDQDLTYYVDGQQVGNVSNVSVAETSDAAYRFEMTTPSERTGQVHTVEVGNQRATAPVFVDVPDRRMGDTLGQGSVGVVDVLQTNRVLTGVDRKPGFDIRVANVTRKGSIGVRDVLDVNQILTGVASPENLTVQDSTLPANVSGDTNEVTVTVENAGDLGTLDGVALELVNNDTGETTVVGAEHVDLPGRNSAENDAERADQFTFNIDASNFDAGDYEVVISQETTAPPHPNQEGTNRLEETLGTVTVE